MNPDQLEDYLRSKSIVRLRNESSGKHAITDCPLCEKVKHLYVNLSHDKLGLWDCKRCGAKGHMNALREAFGDEAILRNGVAKDVKVAAIKDLTSGLERALGRTKRGQSPAPPEAPKPKPVNRNSPFAFREGMDDESHKTLREVTYNETTAVWNPVMSYLQNDRKLELETIIEFNLGAHSVRVRGGGTRWFLTIPVYDPHGRLLNMRFRTIPGPCPVCNGSGCDDRLCKEGETKKTYMRCPGKPSALFNAHRLNADKNAKVYITEGEMDVIAMWQYGVRSNVVSGTAGAGSWLDEWLDILEPYDSFLLLYDSDPAGEAGAKSVAQKLGEYRCSRVVLPEKDAGDCLIAGIDRSLVEKAIERSQPLMDLKLRRVDDYMEDIEALVNQPESLKGSSTGSQKLDSCIGGWRPGLVVVTGDTGAGKTTFTTWAALEQARKYTPVLLTSFEQRPIGTVQKLLRAQMGGEFTKATPEERGDALQALGKMPIHIVDHYGHMDPAKVIEAIRYAVRRHDVKVAVIDHLGFLVDPSAPDERRAIENVVRALATVAIYDNVTVILVAHPSRMHHSQQRRVKIQDLKGASAIEQDAHMGIVVARVLPTDDQAKTAAWVYIDKVRSEFGLPGSKCYLYFDREACVFADRWEETPASVRETASSG